MAAATSARPWVALTGTHAQVAWARTIRRQLLSQVDQLREIAADRLRAGHLSARTAEGFVLAIEGTATVAAERSASWWIEHRGVRPELLIADHAAGSNAASCLVCRGMRARRAWRAAAR